MHVFGVPHSDGSVTAGVIYEPRSLSQFVVDATVRDWDAWHETVHDDAVWLQEQLDASALDDNIDAIVLFCHSLIRSSTPMP